MPTQFTTQTRPIKVNEYQALRSTTGWAMLEDEVVRQALKNDVFSVCAFAGEKLIGIGRIVGDGAIYFYIQDVIVLPEYRGKGAGNLIMQQIEGFLQQNAPNNAFIGLMAAEGVEEFYLKFGYARRPAGRAGMFRLIQKKFTN